MKNIQNNLKIIQNQILAALPSKLLQQAVLRQNHCFSELELLAIVCRYLDNYHERIATLLLLADALPEPFSFYARSVVEWMEKSFALFTQNEEGAVFELHIKTSPSSYDERYLCASYDAALKVIPLFFEEYESEENEHTRYEIVKRKILSGDVFSEDNMGFCYLGPNRVVRAVEMYTYPEPNRDSCDGFCSECQRLCTHRVEIAFPCFVHDGDIVAFINPYDRCVRYGVSLFGEDPMPEDYCIIPLDAYMFRCHYYDKYIDAHEHISAPHILDIIGEDQLPWNLRQHYACLMKKVAEEEQ